jgi:glycosyltransferase involved in cell wall biosynthesis
MNHNIEFDVIIPTFGRPEYLRDTLKSLSDQITLPKSIIIVDNNTDSYLREQVQKSVELFSELLNIVYFINIINSGAVARNLGVTLSSSKFVAFLDDDVILEPNYYFELIKIFENPRIVGAQGVDVSLINEFKRRKCSNFLVKIGLFLENFFETSTIFGLNSAKVRPSLAVEHPDLRKEFSIESEWTSTCAGMFRRNLFETIQFPDNFVKYSWNEYLYFSYMIFKRKLGLQNYNSRAKYKNIQTNSGRLPSEELVFMSEIYDYFVFSKLFDNNIYNNLIYFKSRLGKFLYSLARIFALKSGALSNFLNLILAFKMVILYKKDILSGNFDCYNLKFNSLIEWH